MDQIETAPSTQGRSVRRWLGHATGFLLVLVAGATVAAYLGRLQLYLELASHFRAQYLAAAVVLTAFVLLLKSWRWAVFGVAVVAINFGAVLPYYWPQDSPAAEPNLRILVSNVLMWNNEYHQILSLAHAQRPDVIVLLEVDDKWMQALSTLSKDYPFLVSEPRDNTSGIAVFSRLPFTGEQVFELAGFEAPAIATHLDVAGRPITLLAIHTRPPGSRRSARMRDAQMHVMARMARQNQNLVVCGDFNATPWSPIFKDTVAESGLKDARLGFGIQGTWPVKYSPCLIPIDHCLVSPEIGVRSFRALPSIGSDHFPLLVELVVPPLQKQVERAETVAPPHNRPPA